MSYSGSYTYKSVGLAPTLASMSEWIECLKEAASNVNETSTIKDTWYQYALIAEEYYGTYIDTRDITNNPWYPNTTFSDTYDLVFMDTDWYSVLWGGAHSTTHDLSISGGGDYGSYHISFGYAYDGSTLQWGENENNRYNIRVNNVFKVSDRFTINSSIGYSRKHQVTPTNISGVLSTSLPQPGLPVSTVDGKPYAWGTWESPAWKSESGGDNWLTVTDINISEQFKYDLGKGFSVSADLGYSSQTSGREIMYKSIDFYNYAGDILISTNPIQDETYYQQTSTRTDFYSATVYANYTKTINDAHNISATVGGAYENTDYGTFGAKVTDINENLDALLGSGTITFTHSASSMKYQYALASAFGRLNYDYKSKYLVEAQARYDGSSKFLPENRWALFYGFSLGWRLTEEQFMQNVSWLDELKLRASYGQVGNQSGISTYDGVMLYNSYSSTGALLGDGLTSYLSTSGDLASTTREWERIHNYNVGIDFAVLGSRLSGSLDAFRKENNNMLVSNAYPGTLGIDAPTTNTGEFLAYGFEATATWRDKFGKNGDFRYSVGGSFSFARNELVNNNTTNVISAGYNSQVQGYPLASIFGYQYAGKIQNETQLSAYLTKYYDSNSIDMPSTLRLGDHMYADQNGDGKLDTDDLIYLGSDTPEISYSMNGSISWKGIDLSVVFQGVANRTVFRTRDNFSIPTQSHFKNFTNIALGNSWSESTPNAKYPKMTFQSDVNDYNYQASSWSIENGAYLRLKNVTLAYTLPESIMNKVDFLSSCRIYFTGSDLWEATQMSDGWDPEAVRDPSGTERYPFTRNYTVGLNLTF